MVDEKKEPLVVVMPNLGEAATEGVVRFLKRPGEPVKRDEPVLEVETDKVVVELTAPESGVIASVSPDSAVIRVGEPVYTLHVHGVASAPAATRKQQVQGPALAGWQQVWDVRHAQKRASQLAVAGGPRWPAEAALVATALVRALLAVPAVLATVAQGRPTEVTVEHCEVTAGEVLWSHVSLRPDDTIHGALAKRSEGRRLDARVRVIRLAEAGIVAASPANSGAGMTIVIGPAVTEAVVEDGVVVARARATVTVALGQAVAAEQVQAFAAALGEQLRAV